MSGVFGKTVARLTTDTRYQGANRIATSGRTMAGVRVDPDNAITLAAVWACLRFLSQTVGILPWHALKSGIKGAEVQSKHPVDWLLSKRPSKEWSSFQFRETLTHWALRWGNGYAEIEPDQRGNPFAMWPMHPERVLVCRASADSIDAYGDPINAGDLFYEVDNIDGHKLTFNFMRIYHVRGFGEGPVGVNVIAYAAESLGWAKAVQLFGASFFGNGMNPAGVVSFKKPLKPDGLRKQKAEFEGLYKGPRNMNRTAFLDNDATWTRTTLNARESQLTDVNVHLIDEVCRWFGVPPHKVMQLLRATFSNIEHQAIEVVTDSILPWAKRFEDEADFKLFGQNRPALYTKMNVRGLMRGDAAARIAYYTGMTKIGAYSPNRVLELEDENTIGDVGDIHTMQSQNVTLETIAAGINNPPPEPPPPPDDAPLDLGGGSARQAENVCDGVLERLGVENVA